jgi:PAS domain S-box-containing protein
MSRVLIVDDEKSIRRTLGEFLRVEGYEVEEAEDAEAAQRHLEKGAFDVVVTDIVLPRVSGVELLHRIHGLAPDVQVVMMTGEPTVETATESLRAGATDYLFKPIGKPAILKVVANAARIKSLADAKARLEKENLAYRENLEKLVKERTAQLELSEARFRALVETTMDWVWELDAQGRYDYVSPKIYDLLGYTSNEVLGKTPFDLMPEGESQGLAAVFREIVSKRKSFASLQNTCRHKDGKLVLLETSGVPVFDSAGHFRGYRGVDRDVTDRKRLEEQLRQAQKLEAVGQLAGGVAHDFNNILAAIMMQLGLIQMSPNLDEETRIALKDLGVEAERAANLTRQLLLFSRRAVRTLEPLDLNDVVGNLLKMLHRLIGEHIKLELGDKISLPFIEGDAGMIGQVLMNLVVNARDAMPKGGTIAIRTAVAGFDETEALLGSGRRPGRFVTLEVSDSGCGMDPETLQKIFDPFFTTKEPGKGTGLGLATVHGIVAQHKGWVEVESQMGVGTTFRVYLPVVDGSRLKVSPNHPQPPVAGGKETILVVEDQHNVRRVLSQTLRVHGYAVFEAGNGQEAVTLWQTHGPKIDLLFTDMIMPEGMTGLELAARLRDLKPDLKVIISSGYSTEISDKNAIDRAGILYLPKPYEGHTLANTVRRCLDNR